jgi:hypothetical protein
MIRRMKKEFLNNLPEKERTLRYVTPDPAYIEEIKKLQRDSRKIEISLSEGGLDEAARAALSTEQRTMGNALNQLTGKSKIHAINSELKTLISIARKERLIAEEADDLKKAALSIDQEDLPIKDVGTGTKEEKGDVYDVAYDERCMVMESTSVPHVEPGGSLSNDIGNNSFDTSSKGVIYTYIYMYTHIYTYIIIRTYIHSYIYMYT